MLKEKIFSRSPGIITYGITPPKKNLPEEKVIKITEKHLERLQKIDIDGLIIYDIQEETERTGEIRPFPFLPTLDAYDYCQNYLNSIDIPKIVYRCVGKYSKNDFEKWIISDLNHDRFSVFVGAASSNQNVMLKLNEAYELINKNSSNLILGGVTIPERHLRKNDEHLRIINKMKHGCKFFVSQAVYNLEASKNLLSDYYYFCSQNEYQMVPFLFTLTPCGSIKTLEFMKWLGINIPKWLENELIHSQDILDKSIRLLIKQFQELAEFAKEKRIPIGCNIESISVRKVEIEASIQLVEEIKSFL